MELSTLDKAVLKVLDDAVKPMTIPQIERKVAEAEVPADTYDVQRSVRRLVKFGLLALTPQLDIAKAKAS